MTPASLTDDLLIDKFGELIPLKRTMGVATEAQWLEYKTTYYASFVRKMETDSRLNWNQVTNQDAFLDAFAWYFLWKACESIHNGVYIEKAKIYKADYEGEIATISPIVNGSPQGTARVVFCYR